MSRAPRAAWRSYKGVRRSVCTAGEILEDGSRATRPVPGRPPCLPLRVAPTWQASPRCFALTLRDAALGDGNARAERAEARGEMAEDGRLRHHLDTADGRLVAERAGQRVRRVLELA